LITLLSLAAVAVAVVITTVLADIHCKLLGLAAAVALVVIAQQRRLL
jgi:hypothetical protein